MRKECNIYNALDLVVKTTFVYDISEIFGNTEIKSDLSLTMIDLIRDAQKDAESGNKNLFVTENPISDGLKAALANLFKRNGIIVSDAQFITLDEYKEKAHEGENKVVVMLGKGMSGKMAGMHSKGDKVLLANQDENDYMLLANMAIVAASAEK